MSPMPAAAIPIRPRAICHKSSPDPFFSFFDPFFQHPCYKTDPLFKKENLAHFAARELMFLLKG